MTERGRTFEGYFDHLRDLDEYRRRCRASATDRQRDEAGLIARALGDGWSCRLVRFGVGTETRTPIGLELTAPDGGSERLDDEKAAYAALVKLAVDAAEREERSE